jgi:transglutaminase-like putative cysteine protease
MDNYLAATSEIDFHSNAIQEFMRDLPVNSSLKDQAIWIYEKVRDGFLYDPYHLNLSPNALKASVVLTKNRAWCVEKALVAVACFRRIGIPARFGFGIVKNHIGVEKLVSYLKKDEIVFHGFVEVFLNDKWTKCTPAFDKRICALNKVAPLAWDTENDSLFQAFRGDEKYMEYIHFYGSFATIPFDLMLAEMKKHYPHLFEEPINTKAFSFQF